MPFDDGDIQRRGGTELGEDRRRVALPQDEQQKMGAEAGSLGGRVGQDN